MSMLESIIIGVFLIVGLLISVIAICVKSDEYDMLEHQADRDMHLQQRRKENEEKCLKTD